MIKKDFSYTECLILIKIAEADFGNPKYLTISKVAEVIKINVGNPRFWNVMKYLEQVGIIIQVEQIGSNKIISINQDKIEEFIYKQEVIAPIIKYYEDQHALII
jgi:hypothetical protein